MATQVINLVAVGMLAGCFLFSLIANDCGAGAFLVALAVWRGILSHLVQLVGDKAAPYLEAWTPIAQKASLPG